MNNYLKGAFYNISQTYLRYRCGQTRPNPYAGDPQDNPLVYADVLNDGLEATKLPGTASSIPLLGRYITGMDVFVSLTGRFTNSPSDRSVTADITKIVAVSAAGFVAGNYLSEQGGRLGQRIGRSGSARIGGAVVGSVAAVVISVAIEKGMDNLTSLCARNGM